MKITILQIRAHGDEDDVYVFEGWHDEDALMPFIKNWCNGFNLNYDDPDDTWFKTVHLSYFDKLL